MTKVHFSGPNMVRVHEWCVFLQDNVGLARIMDYILGSGGLTVTINITYCWVTMILNKMADTFVDDIFKRICLNEC